MAYYALRLQAGVPYTHNVAGKLILLDSTGDADGVDIATIRNGTPQSTMPMRKAAFRLVEAYDGVMLTAAVTTTVGIFLSFEDVQLGVADGAAVKVPEGVNITNADPIPVEFAGTVAPVLGMVTIDNTNAEAIPMVQQPGATFAVSNVPCSAIVNLAPVSAGLAAVALVADATLRRLRVRNGHATATIAIGGAGVTLAGAAVVLLPGDVWNETDAAGAAWYVVSDTAATPVQMQGLK
ncbi:hypothetical protein [Janthinobacterium sp. PSPC3-1]|uniref:hypothetical protein n=1 Tax=Janthinobacterium sp. PSPC3-1 TaxID=2804653 RepID=UPI003CFB9FDC